MTEWAAKVLDGVVRYRPEPPGVMVPDQTGVWVDHRHVTDAIAALTSERDRAMAYAQQSARNLDTALEQAAALRERMARMEETLRDTTDFIERHSNRWDGANGRHPAEVVEAARAALTDGGKDG